MISTDIGNSSEGLQEEPVSGVTTSVLQILMAPVLPTSTRSKLPDFKQFVKLKYVKLGYHYLITHGMYLFLSPIVVLIAAQLSTFSFQDLHDLWDHLRFNLISVIVCSTMLVFLWLTAYLLVVLAGSTIFMKVSKGFFFAFAVMLEPSFLILLLVVQWVLHDWDNERCLKLLKNCWNALLEDGKVIIVEWILTIDIVSDIVSRRVFCADLMMLAFNDGEKSELWENTKP